MPGYRKAFVLIASLICTLIVIMAGCTLPVDQPETADLTLDWSVLLSRSVYPTVYPTPVTWDITLTSPGQTDVTAIGITETTWTFTNIARVNWTVTINGKNAAGEVIVQGGSSVDLTTSATQSLTVDVNYLHNGTGPGQIAITLDMAASPSPIDSVDLTLTDPLGAVTHPAVSVVGYTGTYAAVDMPSGSYRAFFLVNAGTKQAMKMETIMVFNELTTDGTIVFAASDFDEPYRPVTGVSLDLATIDQTVNGPSTTLVATIAPANASNQLMTWDSSNPAIATVDQDGLVAPVAEGTTTITVTTVDGGKTAACAVTVTFVHVASVTVAPDTLALVIGGATAQLTATVLPTNASDPSYTWATGNGAVATVSGTGVVTGVGIGSTTITATSTDGGIVGSCSVTADIIHVASITVSPASLTLVQEGSTATLSATILPEDATFKTYTWSSSDETVATVSAAGVVTPLLAGSTLITATSTEGTKTSTCTVNVQPNGQASGGMQVVQPVLNTVTITGSTFMLTSGTNPTYTASYNGTALSYQWYVDGIEAVGATTATFLLPTQNLGTHILTLEVKDQSGLTYSENLSMRVILDPLPITMVTIIGGTYQMGSYYSFSEQPIHMVTLSSFHMSATEITQSQYQSVMGSNPSNFSGNSDAATCPVEKVSWYDALVFCNRLSMQEGLTPVYSISGSTDPAVWGAVPTNNNSTWNAAVMNTGANGYRLPTESEWEYAARGGTTTTSYWGDSTADATVSQYAWYSYNCASKTHGVAQKLPNAYGLYDILGNIYEWCWDWYGTYLSGSQTDPVGPSSGYDRVLRGNSWLNQSADGLRLALRGRVYPGNRSYIVGFRVVAQSGL